MKDLIKLLQTIVENGETPEVVFILVLSIGLIVGIPIGLVKLLNALKKVFVQVDSVSKESFNDGVKDIKDSFDNDSKVIAQSINDAINKIEIIEKASANILNHEKNIEDDIEKLSNVIDKINDKQVQDNLSLNSLKDTIDLAISDSKYQYTELSRQTQALQKDLASLHGTIIGITSNRTKLK